MKMIKINHDVIVLPEKHGKWILMNAFTKTCLAVDSSCFELLSDLESIDDGVLYKKYRKKMWRVWRIEKFSNRVGLLVDPSRYIRDVKKWPSENFLNTDEMIQELQNHFLIINDKKRYLAKFQNKKTILDFEHFGNFHEQLGQNIILEQHDSPDKWWIKQKFTDDLKSVRNNLYRAIQAKYLKKYFRKKIHAGDRIIDIGCGIGYYTNMIAKNNALVLGVDPNQEYINIAKKHAVKNATFERMDIGKSGSLDKIPNNSADFVFMSDALLFYFVPPKLDKNFEIKILLKDIRRILKPTGFFINVEPHYVFWLLPWLGAKKRPFTIITEYQKKMFGVTPTISELIHAYTKGGFSIHNMEELKPHPSYESIDSRAYYFAKEFPLWQLFELKPRD